MGKEIDIVKELEEKKPIIDAVIRKYLPEKFDKKNLEYLLGKPRYEYNTEAPTKVISEPLWDFLRMGGKRWRPALFLMLTEALGAKTENAMDFVLVPEIVHNGSLVIDDIEDNSETRRGKPCAHLKYGVDVSINFGNAMYYMPLISLIKNKNKLPNDKLVRIYEIYAQEMINIHFGQGMDIYWHNGKGNADNVTEGEYLQMCAYKTGTLARMSAKIAAVLAGASEDAIEKVGKFAETVGVAFQIQDDILNLTAESGKGQFTEEYLGSDMTEGKRTLMVIHTIQKANEKDKKRLIQILKMHTKDKKIINEAIELIKKYDAVNYATKRASELMLESWKEIDPLMKPSLAKDKLFAFAKYLIERDV